MNFWNKVRNIGINPYNMISYLKYKAENIRFRQKLHYLTDEQYDFSKESERLLERMLKDAVKSYPYYKKIAKISSLNPRLEQFPIMDKNEIRNHSKELVSVRKKHLVCRKGTTGGSTGEPFGFLISPQHDALHQEFLWKLMGYEKGDKILGIGGFEISQEKREQHQYWEFKSKEQLPYGGTRMSSVYLNENTYMWYLQFINQLQPQFIRGYTSAIYSLAKWMEEQNVELSSPLKAIELTSETCFDYQIEYIEKVFQTPVYLQYGHTEAAVFAYSYDSTRKYKCSPLYGLVEVLDEAGQQVKEGETGEVVVTSYSNFVMPFIRYKTGDLAEYGGCRNGVVTLNKVWGRTQDYVYNRKKEGVLLTAVIFGLHYSAFSHIVRWQMIQNDYGKVLFRIIPTSDFSKEDEKEIYEVFQNEADIATEFEYVEDIPTTVRGKSKLLVQNIKL